MMDLWWFDGEWESTSRQTVAIYEPLDFDGPADARPYVQTYGVDFYDRSGNKMLARNVLKHGAGSSVSPMLVLVGSIWYELGCGTCMYHNGRWCMRYVAWSNSRAAHMANAGWYAFHHDDRWLKPIRSWLRRLRVDAVKRAREIVARIKRRKVWID